MPTTPYYKHWSSSVSPIPWPEWDDLPAAAREAFLKEHDKNADLWTEEKLKEAGL